MVNVNPSYLNWRLEEDTSHYVWLYFDKQDAEINSFDFVVLDELEAILDLIALNKAYKGLVILSAKSTGFIAGADITLFTKFKNINEAMAEPQLGQRVFSKLDSLKIPTVALIHGFCLGGGLELALACRYRIAEDSIKTKLGLPEVKLGLQPGWGGTVRLPKLIGAPIALNMMLTGRSVNVKEALRIGLIDKSVPKNQMKETARVYLESLPPPHKPTLLQSLSNSPLIRPLEGFILKKRLKNKVNPAHYPAPFGLLNNWIRYGTTEQAYAVEAMSCGNLFLTETSKNLVRFFFLQSRLKSLMKNNSLPPSHVHVIGATELAAHLVKWCESAQIKVTRQSTTNINKTVSQADMIIEAVEDDIQAKKKVLVSMEKQAKSDAILVTTTAFLALQDINSKLKQPERLVGIHFIRVVSSDLVELVITEQINRSIIDKSLAFIRILGLMPIIINSNRGLLLYRVLKAYINEAIELMQLGVTAKLIDRSMVSFGMPGPIGLAKKLGMNHPTKKSPKKVSLTEEEIVKRLVRSLTKEAYASFEEGVIADKDLIDAALILGLGFPPFLGGPLHYASKHQT